MTPAKQLNRNGVPRPFLKWAGGKGQLLSELMRRVELAGDFGRYHEPFVGGGALFFELYRLGFFRQGKLAYLSDANERLIDSYLGVRECVDDVIKHLERHQRQHSEEYYYSVRSAEPRTLATKAARIIYLNKTCYNGLYRENRQGKFNVPIGRYTNPQVCDSENLVAVSRALKRAKIESRGFESVLDVAEPNDLVYFDPPYQPVSKTSAFTGYERNGFGEEQQFRLFEVCKLLHDKGVKFILSNSHSPWTLELYDYPNFELNRVKASRLVNSRAERRGKIDELIVRNF